MTEKAEKIDAEEDELYGKGKEAHEVSEELKRRHERLKRITRAKEELEQEARQTRVKTLRERAKRVREAAEAELDPTEMKRKQTRARKAEEEADRLAGAESGSDSGEIADESDTGLPSHRVPTTPEGKPKPKAQRNFTDPDSRIMKRGGEYLQGYNCQIVVDEANQIILAEALTNQPPDCEHLIPMMERVSRNTGQSPRCLSADSGYMSEGNVDYCEGNGIDAYLAVGRTKHGQTCDDDKPRQETGAERAMRDKLASDAGRQIYARRKVIVEPVFGQVKEARGFRRFSLRGKEKAGREWTLVCLCHNLLKLFGVDLNAASTACQPAAQEG